MTRHARTDPPRSAAVRVAVVLAVVLATGAGAALAFVGLTDGAPGTSPTGSPTPTAASTPTPTPTRTTPPPPPPDAVFTLVAAGDVLLHQPVISSARTSDGYDFAPLLAPVEPWVAGADLALCHLEVPVAPAGVAPSGYPRFGAPVQIAAGLAANGWDGCSTASNHSVDRGFDGVVATLDALDAVGLGHVGTARTAEESAQPQVYELQREGQTIRVAHIASTYGTNGLPVSPDAPWSVTLLDVPAMIAEATAAREAGADAVVASVHCCVEYVVGATDQQVDIATQLAASGVIDLMIGHHAHVPQPIAKLPGGPRGDGMWAAYGLGNFVSNQSGECCTARTDSGLLLTATFRKPPNGPVTVDGVEWSSVTVDRPGGHRVLPMSQDVTAGQGAGTLSASELATRHARVVEAVGAEAPERTEPPAPTGPPPTVVARVPAAP